MAVRRRGTAQRATSDRPLAARISEAVEDFAARRPARFAIGIFTALILIFTLLLWLPVSSRVNGESGWTPFVDALFTAVSAICVTGLTVVDMATHWTTFGNVVILIALQVGGIGVLTLASIMGLIVAKRLGLRQKLLAVGDNSPMRVHRPVAESQALKLGEIGGLLSTVAIGTLIIEGTLTLLLIPAMLLEGFDPWTSVWQSFYFAASAFTNTGFTPNAEGMAIFADDPYVLGVISLGVFLGSVGFPVIFALARYAKQRGRLALHVKLTLVTTSILIVLGALAITVLEWSNGATLGAQDGWFRPITGTFLSIMTRSGGFSTVDIHEMNGSSLLIMDMLMFVGGGSASTAGGIKVTTLAILFIAAFAEARGDHDMQAFDRRIPNDVLRLAVSVVLWGATIVATSTVAILHITKEPLDFVLFDVISAFATSGLSTGLTESLPDSGKYILVATMWAGRVGTVTLAAALAASQRAQLFRRAEERPLVG